MVRAAVDLRKFLREKFERVLDGLVFIGSLDGSRESLLVVGELKNSRRELVVHFMSRMQGGNEYISPLRPPGKPVR